MIDETIACLEKLYETSSLEPQPPESPRRRGRKFMDAEDRLKVSRRMKEYWAERRLEKARQENTAVFTAR